MSKYIQIELENTGDDTKMIEIAYYTEPVLDVNRQSASMIKPRFDEGILHLHNPYNHAVRSFAGISAPMEESYALTDRKAFFTGGWEPKEVKPNANPCAAVIVKRELPPKHRVKIRYILSFGSTEESVKKLIRSGVREITHGTENTVRVKTPDPLFDEMFNTWLPWQTIGGRVYARTGFYQCGGAYGFRDQLQDVMTMVTLNPKLTKRQITRACTSQFIEGDVLHWWHNLPKYGGGKKGVRTRYSDDLLWLPLTVCEYVEKTGDTDLLDIKTSYATGDILLPHEHEKYIKAGMSETKESVYDHCKRAIDKACSFGEHGLPLMGCGDWNDGYNNVGAAGKGESVWLAQFLSIVLKRFATLARRVEDEETAQKYEKTSKSLLEAVDEHCYEDNHYIRAFYDNGMKMGSEQNDECKIDLLPQSFSVIADMPDKERVRKAMDFAFERLVDREAGIIKLFSPAFADSAQEPGYVKSYPAGVRENGGQYTHAAVWFLLACLKMGDTERAYELLNMINPAKRYEAGLGDSMQTEPYYLTGDVYANKDAYGRGGWSIYTGAAGWYYHTLLEHFLGIRFTDGFLTVKPCLPEEWQSFSAQICYDGTKITLEATRDAGYDLTDNGHPAEKIPLDRSEHTVVVKIK